MLVFLAAAVTAAPLADLRPVPAPWDAPEQYAAFAKSKGRTDALACTPFLPDEVQLCFRVWEDGRRRWVTTADLAAWDTTLEVVAAEVTKAARERDVPVERIPIDGMAPSYLRLRDGDGWAAAALLSPARLVDALGGTPILVGVPTEGVAVAWRAGDPEVDHVMTVGVRELHDAGPAAVTATVHAWTGTQFVRFGRADPIPSDPVGDEAR